MFNFEKFEQNLNDLKEGTEFSVKAGIGNLPSYFTAKFRFDEEQTCRRMVTPSSVTYFDHWKTVGGWVYLYRRYMGFDGDVYFMLTGILFVETPDDWQVGDLEEGEL